MGTVAWRASSWVKGTWLTPTNHPAVNVVIHTLNGAPVAAKGETETDAEGRFTVTFTPQPKADAEPEADPSFRFTVTANVTGFA